MTIEEEVMAMLPDLLPPGKSMPAGATLEEIAAFSARTGLQVPPELSVWLQRCNGARAVEGFYGIGTPPLDIEQNYEWHPEMRDKEWIPIASDGCGSRYVIDTRSFAGTTHPVYFIDHESYEGDHDYVVASGLWKFLWFYLENEKIRGEERWTGPPRNQPTQTFAEALADLNEHMKQSKSYWPFNKRKVLARDPDLKKYRGSVPLAWKTG